MAPLAWLPKSLADQTESWGWTNTVTSAMGSLKEQGEALMQPIGQQIASAMPAPPPFQMPEVKLPEIRPFELPGIDSWGFGQPAPAQQPQQPSQGFSLGPESQATATVTRSPSAASTGGFSLPGPEAWGMAPIKQAVAAGIGAVTGTGAPSSPPTGAPVRPGAAPEQLGAIEEGNPERYFATAGPYARQVERETGVPAALSLAISANETGYGQRRYMAGANNYHGIQARAGEPGAVPYKDWRPGPGGQQEFYNAAQRSFADPMAGFRGFADFLTSNPRYASALAAYRQSGDVNALAADIHKAGYAEDPAYTQKITSIMKGIPVSTGVGEVTDTRGVPLSTTPQARAAPQVAGGGLDVPGITKAYAGVPYTFGGPGGRGQGLGATTDCSGFVSAVFKSQYGLDLPAHTDAAYNALKQRGAVELSQADARPGDVVFYMGAGTGGNVTHHMGLVSGPGRVLDMSVSGGDGVRDRDIGHAGRYVILRDPRVNGSTQQQRSQAPPPIVPSGVAEQSGGQKLSRQEINAASEQPALVSRAAPEAPAAGTAGADALAAAPQPTYSAPFQDDVYREALDIPAPEAQREAAAPPEPDTVWSAFRAVNGRPPTGQELMALVSRVYGGLGG